MININFVLNNSVFHFPCSRKLLAKIPEDKEELFNQLFVHHEYHVNSKVQNEVFQSFLNYWKDDIFPQINSDNIIEYFQLNIEFGFMEDYFASQKYKKPAFNLAFLAISDRKQYIIKENVEKDISLHLDDYLTNYQDNLANVHITSLYNIFFNPERNLDDHDRAYQFIVDAASKHNKNIFCLLPSLDGAMFRARESKIDAYEKINDHFGFCPQNVAIAVSSFQQEIADLAGSNSRLSTQVRSLEEQVKARDDQVRSLEEQVKTRDDQVRSLEEQVKTRDDQVRSLEEQVKARDDQVRSLEEQVKARDDKIKAFEESKKKANLKMIFNYTGSVQQAILPPGKYRLEVWGAQGGSYNDTYFGGKGGYSAGEITLSEETTLYVYVGGKGDDCQKGKSGGWNGGGSMNNHYALTSFGGGGGGATDISLLGSKGSSDWNNRNHFYSRIIVAGGGSSASYGWRYELTESSVGGDSCGGFGGGEVGGGKLPGTQTQPGLNGSFGVGADEAEGNGGSPDGAAGGGWYGGGAFGTQEYYKPSGGGSGYVYTQATESSYPSGCLLSSSHYLTNAATKGGNMSFPNITGTGNETGHCGHGAAKITSLF